MNWNLRYAADKVDLLATYPGIPGMIPDHDPNLDRHVHTHLHELVRPIKARNGTSITHIVTGATKYGQVFTNLYESDNPTIAINGPDLPGDVWESLREYTHSHKYTHPDYLPQGFDPQDPAVHQTILDRTKEFLKSL